MEISGVGQNNIVFVRIWGKHSAHKCSINNIFQGQFICIVANITFVASKARVSCNGDIQRNRVAHFDRFIHSLNGDFSCTTATCINCHSRGNAHGKYHRQSKKNRQHAFSVFHVFSFLSL